MCAASRWVVYSVFTLGVALGWLAWWAAAGGMACGGRQHRHAGIGRRFHPGHEAEIPPRARRAEPFGGMVLTLLRSGCCGPAISIPHEKKRPFNGCSGASNREANMVHIKRGTGRKGYGGVAGKLRRQ